MFLVTTFQREVLAQTFTPEIVYCYVTYSHTRQVSENEGEVSLI